MTEIVDVPLNSLIYLSLEFLLAEDLQSNFL